MKKYKTPMFKPHKLKVGSLMDTSNFAGKVGTVNDPSGNDPIEEITNDERTINWNN